MPTLLTSATGYAEVKEGPEVVPWPWPAVEETTLEETTLEETTLEEEQSTTILIQEEVTMVVEAEVEAAVVEEEEEEVILEPISCVCKRNNRPCDRVNKFGVEILKTPRVVSVVKFVLEKFHKQYVSLLHSAPRHVGYVPGPTE